jgi:hypothetical protein
MKRFTGEYVKHVYWVNDEDLTLVRNGIHSLGIRPRIARGVVCGPLAPGGDITVVPPGVWSETCARQGSWYRSSDKRGLTLIVSPFELEGFERLKHATIRATGFRPPRLADLDQKRRLALDPEIVERIPPEWCQAGEAEKVAYLRWARRLGSEAGDYDLLFLSHTANHANFIKPRLFIREQGRIIPYSIERSAHLCSCCLELFQVLGDTFERKLVAPCPGAALFAHLDPDRYLLVESTPPGYKPSRPECPVRESTKAARDPEPAPSGTRPGSAIDGQGLDDGDNH